MSTQTTSTSSANASLGLLASEAESLYAQAKRYREEMDKLPAEDTSRAVYEKTILDLLARARNLSSSVITTARSS